MRGTIISNVSELRGVDERKLVTLLLMLEVLGRPESVVLREAPEVVGIGAEVGVGADARVEMKEKNMVRTRMAKPTTAVMLASETSTELQEVTQGATVVARSATKRRNAPDRCSIFGGKGHSAKICANVVTVFACEADTSGSDSDGVSAEKCKMFSSAMQQASFSTSLIKGIEMRSLGRWGISR